MKAKIHNPVLTLILISGMAGWCPLLVHAQVSPSPSASSLFKVVPTPNENFNNGLLAASASASNDIWAVGQSTMHFDGTKWTAFPAPMIHGDNTSFLGGVADISPTEAWAVGTVNIGEAH